MMFQNLFSFNLAIVLNIWNPSLNEKRDMMKAEKILPLQILIQKEKNKYSGI